MAVSLLHFQIKTSDGSEGAFEYDSPLTEELEAYLQEIGLVDSELQSPAQLVALIKKCTELVAKDASFLEAYLEAAQAQLDLGQPEEAFRWCIKGLKYAEDCIPESFAGTINWHDWGNRTYLDLHQTLVRCLVWTGQMAEAMVVAERHLQMNPNDNLGVRYLLADLYAAANLLDEGLALMSKEQDSPTCSFNLAYLYFQNAHYAEALLHLRRGFLQNHYIADALLGCEVDRPRHQWESNSDQGVDAAIDYANGPAGSCWQDNEEALNFLDWAYHCAVALSDRAEWMHWKEMIDASPVGEDQRSLAIAGLNRVIDEKITQESSAAAIRSIQNRYGETFPVWDLRAYL